MATFAFIVPVFKTEPYLPRCLDSIAAQTDADFDVVVVDDCSPAGNAGEVVAKYGPRYKCVRHDKNLGLFQARATALEHTAADYVIPLDSDDYVMPELVSKVRAAVENSAADVVVYHMSRVRGGKCVPVKYNHRAGICTGREALEQVFEGRIFNPVCGKVIRREIMQKVYAGLGVGKDFYLNSTEDLCWLLPALILSERVSFITYDGYRYWQGEGSLSRSRPTEAWFRNVAGQCRKSVDTVAAYAERSGLPPETVRKIRRMVLDAARWLVRTYGDDLPPGLFPPEILAEADRLNHASKLRKLLKHVRYYGIAATWREVCGKE